MKRLGIITIMSLAVFAVSCKKEVKTIEEKVEDRVQKVPTKIDAQKKKITMKLEPKSGSNSVGGVVFKEVAGKVGMQAVFSGMEPGSHAIHIHEKADCSSADGKSSGGHWNPTAQPHGAWGSPNGYHKGDIGNFIVDANGNGTISFTTDQWCIGCGDEKKDILGKAVIVHQGTDDLTSQPSGAAGARISCGGIIE